MTAQHIRVEVIDCAPELRVEVSLGRHKAYCRIHKDSLLLEWRVRRAMRRMKNLVWATAKHERDWMVLP